MQTDLLMDWMAAWATDPLPVWIAAAAIATLLAHAALAKFTDLPLLEQNLAAYRVPHAALALATRLLPTLELLAAVLLLTPWRPLGAALAAALLLAYAGAMAWHHALGHPLDCGCGGEPRPVSWALVARNLGLALVAGLAACPLSPRVMGWGDFAVVVAAVALATLLYAAFNQVLRHPVLGRARPTLFGRS